MSLQITMIKAPESVAVAGAPLSIGEQGGTLGRGAENTWVLDDPDLYLSSLHCQFSFENGVYYLTDQSTNGTFYAGSPDPLGKGMKTAISDNAHLVIGDYEFVLSVSGQSAIPADPFSGQAGDAGQAGSNSFTTPLAGDALEGFASNPFTTASQANEPMLPAGSGDSDPLAALDRARGGGAAQTPAIPAGGGQDPFSGPTHSDGGNSLNQQIDWPSAATPQAGFSAGTIPDDWDADEIPGTPEVQQPGASQVNPPVDPTPVAPTAPIQAEAAAPNPEMQSRQRELEQANANMQVELDQLKRQLSQRPHTGASDNQVDSTFIEALGFAGHNLTDDEIMQINRLAGEVFREMVSGLMQVLGARSSIKNEFRINVTTIQPVENNPLKFSANVNDALENMFLKQGNAFKKPVESVREGFEGVAEHQVAVLAGIREAFKAVIGRFDPVAMEENFAKQHRGGLLPGSQKAKYWEAYLDYYEELAGDIDKSFQYLFGDGFVRAYEDQLQKLAVSRKSRNIDNEK